MCLNPIHIKNTNYGSKNPQLLILNKDTTHAFMEVPCGRCEQCVAAKQSDFVQRVQSESKYNHLFFATLTYDNDHLPRLSVDVPVVKPEKSQSDKKFDSSQHHTSTLFDRPLSDVESEQFQFDSRDRFVPIELVDSDEFLSLDAFDVPANNEAESLAQKELAAARLVQDSKRMKSALDAIKKAQDDSHLVAESLDDAIEYETISFAYADIHDVQLLLKNVRDNLSDYPALAGRCLRYAAVSELGKQNGRPHFHILFFLEHRPEDFDPNGVPNKAVLRTIEAQLRTIVRKYWAENVGTRKNPVYVPRFKYARKWSFGRIYTNYDLHWVDPSLTKDMTANVGYYVSKYMMKGSDRDQRRQQFLRLNLQEDEYNDVWKTIKCRMTCSKGLGLDARYITIEEAVEQVTYKPLDQYARELSDYLDNCDDLPDPDFVSSVLSRSYRVIRKRVLIPNFELAEKIRKDLLVDRGLSPGPVYIDPLGNHRPLSHYYQRFGYIYTLPDAIRIITEYRGPEKVPPTKEEADAAAFRLDKRRRLVDAHSPFDNVSTVDMPDDDSTLKQYIY